jgi:myo-inositol 2-dehydrogenase/D-chiro-inositol 1-dehydrogenase
MSVKICMIGCGSFAQLCHGPAQRKYADSHPDVRLAACCDVDENRAREYARAFGFARHSTDISAMLTAEKPEAVVVAVPPAMTCGVASLVLERGFPLLLEKPPGMSRAELGRLIAAAEKGGGRAQVAFNRRYMPVMRRAHEILAAGIRPESVGRIDYEMIRFDRWEPDFSTTAIHALDAALFLARSPFLAAEIRLQTQKSGDREAMNVAIEAECAAGTRVLVNIQPVAGVNADSAKIHAVGQSLAIKIPVSPQSTADGALEHWRGDKLITTFSDRDCDVVEKLGVFGETEAFLNAVRSGSSLAPGLQDCHQQVALMEAIRLRRSGLIRFERR